MKFNLANYLGSVGIVFILLKFTQNDNRFLYLAFVFLLTTLIILLIERKKLK